MSGVARAATCARISASADSVRAPRRSSSSWEGAASDAGAAASVSTRSFSRRSIRLRSSSRVPSVGAGRSAASAATRAVSSSSSANQRRARRRRPRPRPGRRRLQVATEADELAVRLGRRGRRRRDRGRERVDALGQDVEATRVTSLLLRVVPRRREHASPCVPSTRAVRSPAGGLTCSLKGYRSVACAPRSPFSGT